MITYMNHKVINQCTFSSRQGLSKPTRIYAVQLRSHYFAASTLGVALPIRCEIPANSSEFQDIERYSYDY
jgi:hypothetical protein